MTKTNANNVVAAILLISSIVCVITLVTEYLSATDVKIAIGSGIIMSLSAIAVQLFNLK